MVEDRKGAKEGRVMIVHSEIEEIKRGPYTIRAEVHEIPMPTIAIDVSDEQARKNMVEAAEFELKSWRWRYAGIAELAGVHAVIDERLAFNHGRGVPQ